jgi:hypothetical protein
MNEPDWRLRRSLASTDVKLIEIVQSLSGIVQPLVSRTSKMRTRLQQSGQPVVYRSGSSIITEGCYAMWRTATKQIYDKPRETFRGWLLTQTYRIDGVGKIARGVAQDSCLGQRLSAESVRQHTLTCHSAAPAVIDAFNQAIAEWQQAKGHATLPTQKRITPDRVLNPPSLASWSGHHTSAHRGRTWVSVRDQASQFGDILRRAMPKSRSAGRAVVRRTSLLLSNLVETNRERRTRTRDRRIPEVVSRNRHPRATGPKGGSEPSSAGDRWYERVAAGR